MCHLHPQLLLKHVDKIIRFCIHTFIFRTSRRFTSRHRRRWPPSLQRFFFLFLPVQRHLTLFLIHRSLQFHLPLLLLTRITNQFWIQFRRRVFGFGFRLKGATLKQETRAMVPMTRFTRMKRGEGANQLANGGSWVSQELLALLCSLSGQQDSSRVDSNMG
ncbi:unnamed protein product [Vicia faba]|uniref:Uncharacterized protein n=1 Tax=Vicia faba TaxID=3906 RepID=A0AAV1B8Z9_VICFA|nr:unnamed protein product [Vicia faba]